VTTWRNQEPDILPAKFSYPSFLPRIALECIFKRIFLSFVEQRVPQSQSHIHHLVNFRIKRFDLQNLWDDTRKLKLAISACCFLSLHNVTVIRHSLHKHSLKLLEKPTLRMVPLYKVSTHSLSSIYTFAIFQMNSWFEGLRIDHILPPPKVRTQSHETNYSRRNRIC
jgi:hypothetical protein